MKVLVIFDGGSQGNPGAAYGSYWIKVATEKKARLQRVTLGHGTNNEAEYRTLIHALEDLLNGSSLSPKSTSLTIRSDSALVVRQLQRTWKVKSKSLRPLFLQASDLLNQFEDVEFIHTPRKEIRAVLGH